MGEISVNFGFVSISTDSDRFHATDWSLWGNSKFCILSVQVNFVTPKFNPKTKFITFYAGIAYS